MCSAPAPPDRAGYAAAMGGVPHVLFFVLFALLAIAMVVLGWQMEKKRRLALAAWAAANDLRFHPDKDKRFDSRLPFSCLDQGSNRYAYNRMSGRRADRDVLAFDYHYETYSTNSKGHRQTHHHKFSAIAFDTGLPLQPLKVRPEGFFDRIAEMAGFDDIDFEWAAFSRKFHVKAPRKKWAFDVIHQATMEFLMEQPTFHWEMSGPWLLVWKTSPFKLEEFSTAFATGEGILDRLPRYLLEELKGAHA